MENLKPVPSASTSPRTNGQLEDQKILVSRGIPQVKYEGQQSFSQWSPILVWTRIDYPLAETAVGYASVKGKTDAGGQEGVVDVATGA